MSFRLQSRPLLLRWAGWEADTYTLQKHGWEISADQDVAYDAIRVAFRHPKLDVRGITERADYNYQLAAEDHRQWRQLPPLHVEHLVNRMSLVIAHPTIGDFRAVDAVPQLARFDEIRSIDDLAHFAPAQAQQQLIIPEPETVPELLAKIVEMQSGARLERFREEIREERAARPGLVHAQIISFPRAA